MSAVAVLFARADSNYKAMPECDVFDIDRDARTFIGGIPVVAHPPCRAWGRLRQFSKPRDDEKMLAVLAVLAVRKNGGVLEHPAESSLWGDQLLPWPGRAPDQFGGWTMAFDQFHFGHRAEKSTWLYIVGCHPDDLPPIPHREGKPTHCIRPTKSYPRLPSVTKSEREHTPAALAEWLVEVARRCQPMQRTAEMPRTPFKQKPTADRKPMRRVSKTNARRESGGEDKLCRGQVCFLDVPGCCRNDIATVVPCHSNQAKHGKGMGRKADDIFTVPGCRDCHAEIDQGKRFSKAEKFAIWDAAYERWVTVRNKLMGET